MTYILVIADLLDKGNSLKRWRRPSKERVAEQQAKRFHHLPALNEAAFKQQGQSLNLMTENSSTRTSRNSTALLLAPIAPTSNGFILNRI
jgi:hypothetical protein